MNAGKSYMNARARAQERANVDGRPRWLFCYNGAWWIETSAINRAFGVNAEVLYPEKGVRDGVDQTGR